MHIKELLSQKPLNLLNIYFTAGFPKLDSLMEIIPALEQAGVDMVELGLPYSDPLSDGPTIQASSHTALANGITTEMIFQQLAKCRTNMATILMGYFNSVYQYGVEIFCKKCREVGVSALIIPDLPIEVYEKSYKDTFKAYNLVNIFLITPETPEERIRMIDDLSDAFIYAVSSSSTTGQKKNIRDSTAFFDKLNLMKLRSPIMVGFNVSTKEDYDFVCQNAPGAIIGSAFIRHISEAKDLDVATHQFVKNIRM